MMLEAMQSFEADDVTAISPKFAIWLIQMSKYYKPESRRVLSVFVYICVCT